MSSLSSGSKQSWNWGSFSVKRKKRPVSILWSFHGQRQTNNIHIYIAVDEFLELCRKLEGGELRYLLKNKKTSGDKTALYQCLGGTSAEKLAKYGRSRADGKSLSRTAQLLAGTKSDFLFVADSGPGETDSVPLLQ